MLGVLSLSDVSSGQSGHKGELRLRVLDDAGAGVAASVVVSSEVNQYQKTLQTDAAGRLDVRGLAYGVYKVEAQPAGFADAVMMSLLTSELPVDAVLHVKPAAVKTVVRVNAAETLIDPSRAGSSNEIGAGQIEDRFSSLPGRSLQELVNSQPGWLYEGNAVLHPRGSEYQTQFVVNGIPLTDNRSPGFAAGGDADDVESLHIYTAGIPAEFGRKTGGVVEVDTRRDDTPGTHGKLVLSGGSYATADGHGEVQRVFGKTALFGSADGARTEHYLNPVVPENFTNAGTTGAFDAGMDEDFSPNDRFTASVRHSLARFQIPNEQVQQAAGQLQTADDYETLGVASFQHIFNVNALATVQGMVRDKSNGLQSNALATPIVAFQQNSQREGYFKATVTLHKAHQDWKAGLESDNTFLHENFRDTITDATQFDDGTPLTFAFRATRPELEQAVFAEDLIHAGLWTISAGLRWDHYQLLVNRYQFSPRLSVARYFPAAQMVLHASYDRVFNTPDSQNILLSSSPLVTSLNPDVLRLPVEPSVGNYYEGGVSKGFAGHLRLDANVFRRAVDHFADDDQLLNTAVSFPISFRNAVIYGAEAKVDVPLWAKSSGFLSYSYIVGNAFFPVNGGLFLGSAVTDARTQLTGHFPDTQDQRNTARARLQYQVRPRWWIAGGAEYGSGLPFDYQGTLNDALAQYGPAVIARLNFDRGRVRSNASIDVASAVDVCRWTTKGTEGSVRLQADGTNLADRLNVIDFGGLFSGNAIGPARSFALRLSTNF